MLQSNVIKKAVRASVRDGRLRFVVFTTHGLKIRLKDVPSVRRYVTNGQSLYLFEANEQICPEKPACISDSVLRSFCLNYQEK